MEITLHLTLTEMDARRLWESDDTNQETDDPVPPIGEDLLNWVAELACP